MHMDNPLAFANLIINDLIPGANEPVKTVKEYREMGLAVDNMDYQAQFDKDLSFIEKQMGGNTADPSSTDGTQGPSNQIA